MGSVLDVLPREGALFTGRTGAVPLLSGQVLIVTPTDVHLATSAVEPTDNAIRAPEESVRIQRPSWMPLFPSPVATGEGEGSLNETFKRLWPRRHESDNYMQADPYTGALIRTSQALRQAAARQQQPVALSFRLAAGDPSDPEAAYQLVKSLEGLADAARMFRLPVVAGELSSDELRFEVGVCTMSAARYSSDNAEPAWLPQAGDDIFLLGRITADLSGSLYPADEEPTFPPPIDLIIESRVQEISADIGHATPLGRGGLLITLARCCAQAAIGVRIEAPAELGLLFGEAQSRMLFFLPSGHSQRLLELAAQLDIPIERLGSVGGAELVLEGAINLDVRELT